MWLVAVAGQILPDKMVAMQRTVAVLVDRAVLLIMEDRAVRLSMGGREAVAAGAYRVQTYIEMVRLEGLSPRILVAVVALLALLVLRVLLVLLVLLDALGLLVVVVAHLLPQQALAGQAVRHLAVVAGVLPPSMELIPVLVVLARVAKYKYGA